jgi:hypothetical protein
VAADRRAAEEATVRRVVEEATVKVAADEKVTGKTVDEATGAIRDSPAPRQSNVPTGVFRNLGMSSSPFSSGASFSDYISFLPSSSSSGAATAMGTAASAAGTTATEAAVGSTPGPALDGEPWTPEGVPEDMKEKYEEEPEVAPEPVLEMVRE